MIKKSNTRWTNSDYSCYGWLLCKHVGCYEGKICLNVNIFTMFGSKLKELLGDFNHGAKVIAKHK